MNITKQTLNDKLRATFIVALVCVSLLANILSLRAQTKQARPNVSAAETLWVEETLKSLTLRERIGQMIVTAASSEFMSFDSERFAEFKSHIQDLKVGGVIVRRGSPNEVAAMTNEMQRLAGVPLLIAADYERGLRMQMNNGTPFTTNMGVGAGGNARAAYTQGKIIAQEMRAMGVNWLYAPVADINNNPDNPVINIRSFGENPVKVAEFVAAAVRGVQDGGVMATVKHFPGHGDTSVDSHIGLATIDVARERLDKLELVPFRAAIAAGVDSVMTAHVALPRITGDNLPATLSPKMTTDVLRGELGFKGIIVTDSLGMGAIVKTFPGGEGSVRAIKAGADVALLPPNPRQALDAIEAAVKRGEITEERINESVRRLLAAKYRLGLAGNRFVDLSKVNAMVEQPANLREAARVAEESITLLRNANNLLPLDIERANKAMFIVVAADADEEEGRAFMPQVHRRAKAARVVKADSRTTANEYEQLLKEASAAEVIIVAPFVKRAALKGTVALPDAQAAFLNQLIELKKPIAVVAFGSPYLVRQFAGAPVYMTAYAIEEVAQIAAVRALFGETAIKGKLPVRVPGLFEVGSGLQVVKRVTTDEKKDANTQREQGVREQ